MATQIEIEQEITKEILMGLEGRITYLESETIKQSQNSYYRDFDILKRLVEVVTLLLINPDDIGRKTMIMEIKLDLEKLLKKMAKISKKRR